MKKTSLIALSTLILVALSLTSCYYDSEEELYPGSLTCNTSNVTYSNSIAPVFANNCNSCHGSSDPSDKIVTDNYASAKANITRIRGAINRQAGFTPMPKNAGQLSTCDLTKIDIWISQGMPNN